MTDSAKPPQKPSLLQIIMSVLGAAFGVQSDKTRQRDFQQGRPGVYIAAGIIFTLLFIAVLVFVVSLVLKQAHG